MVQQKREVLDGDGAHQRAVGGDAADEADKVAAVVDARRRVAVLGKGRHVVGGPLRNQRVVAVDAGHVGVVRLEAFGAAGAAQLLQHGEKRELTEFWADDHLLGAAENLVALTGLVVLIADDAAAGDVTVRSAQLRHELVDCGEDELIVDDAAAGAWKCSRWRWWWK